MLDGLEPKPTPQDDRLVDECPFRTYHLLGLPLMDPILRFVALFAGGIFVVGWAAYGLAKVLPSSDGASPAAASVRPERHGDQARKAAEAAAEGEELDDEEDELDVLDEPYLPEALPPELEQSIPEAETELETPAAAPLDESAWDEAVATDDEAAGDEDGGEAEVASNEASDADEAEYAEPAGPSADGSYWAMTPEDEARVASIYGAGRGFTGEGAGNDGFTGPYGSRAALQAAEQALAQTLANQPAGAVAVPVFVPLPFFVPLAAAPNHDGSSAPKR